MKESSRDLFFLIQSLSSAEKRFFKQQSNVFHRANEKDYLILFDYLDKAEYYNEAQIISDLSNYDFTKFFPQAKLFLYERLTSSLHHFHSSYSKQEKVKQQLHISKILIEKKLLSQAVKMLKKVKKSIDRYEFVELYPIYFEVFRLLPSSVYKKYSLYTIKESAELYEDSLHRLTQRNQIWLSRNYISFIHTQKIKAQAIEELEFLQTTLKQLEAKKKSIDSDFISKVYYFNAQATYAFMNNDLAGAYKSNSALLDAYHSNTDMLSVHPDNYISTYYNFLIDNMVLQKYDAVENELPEFLALQQKMPFRRMPSMSLRILELGSTLKMNLLISKSAFQQANDYADELEPILAKQRKSLSRGYFINVLYMLAYVRFANGAFDASMNFQHQLRNDFHQFMPLELQQNLNMLFLITHFELQNFEILDSLIVAARRFNSQRRKLYETEQLVFQSVRKLAHKTSKESMVIYKKLKEDLSQCASNDARLYNYFDYKRWVDGKLDELKR